MGPSFSEEERRDAQLETIFRTHVAELYRYIYRQVHHAVIADYWREHTQLELLPLEAAEEMPLLSDESDEQMRPLQARIQRLLDGLPSRERDILTLRFFQGYSAAEIGQVLGLSAEYVRVLQLRALRRAALLEAEERSITVEPPNMPYNEHALRVLELAKEEASAFNHNYNVWGKQRSALAISWWRSCVKGKESPRSCFRSPGYAWSRWGRQFTLA